MKSKNRGWLRVLIIILPYIFVVSLFELLGAFIANVDFTNINFEKTSEQHAIMSISSMLGTLLVVWFFMKFLDKESFIKLGFQTKNRLKDFIVGLLIGTVIMFTGYFLLLFLNEIYFQKTIIDLKEILLTIILFICVAVTEEVLLRGYILKNLMISFNKYLALIISSALFAAMHGFNPNIDLFSMSNIFLAGILLGLSYIYTKNLWFPIALHLSWNLFQSLLGFNVSGQDSYSLIEFSIKDNNILNGGAFGFEGSILSVIAMLITIVGIAMYYERKKVNHQIK
ncbi:CPBP family intramembrane glutamic endopeptidase [Lutibacter citreus]|uniref:CPBP family intramembrane glutamic endopeptidase n=1 Tax=Lutibacter citreus TaxID=2138210 RepID=UPI000DBE1FCC|nr:type II CAAX endopeptidase family protein [Lutibacter citreus]